jgi:hypothetical protein
MKKFSILRVILGIIIGTPLIIFIIFFSIINLTQKFNLNNNVSPKSVKRLPINNLIKSFEECALKNPYNAHRLSCSMEYSSKYEPSVFTECKTYGGIIRCPGGAPPISEDCSQVDRICTLTYYNPKISFPISYEQCKSISDGGGSFLSINTCDLIVKKDGVFDKEYANLLFDQCILNGGKKRVNSTSLQSSQQIEYCNYDLFKPDMTRKEYVAKACTGFNNLDDVEKNICDWAKN